MALFIFVIILDCSFIFVIEFCSFYSVAIVFDADFRSRSLECLEDAV